MAKSINKWHKFCYQQQKNTCRPTRPIPLAVRKCCPTVRMSNGHQHQHYRGTLKIDRQHHYEHVNIIESKSASRWSEHHEIHKWIWMLLEDWSRRTYREQRLVRSEKRTAHGHIALVDQWQLVRHWYFKKLINGFELIKLKDYTVILF